MRREEKRNTNGWHESRWANSSNTTVVYAVLYSHDTCLMTWSSSWRSVFSLSSSSSLKKKLNSFFLSVFLERDWNALKFLFRFQVSRFVSLSSGYRFLQVICIKFKLIRGSFIALLWFFVYDCYDSFFLLFMFCSYVLHRLFVLVELSSLNLNMNSKSDEKKNSLFFFFRCMCFKGRVVHLYRLCWFSLSSWTNNGRWKDVSAHMLLASHTTTLFFAERDNCC